jgi:hypothetical protein
VENGEDCNGRQRPQRTVELEDQAKDEEKEKKETNN